MKLNPVRVFSRILGIGMMLTGLGSLLTPIGWDPSVVVPRTIFALLSVAVAGFILVYPERVPLGYQKQEYKRSHLAY